MPEYTIYCPDCKVDNEDEIVIDTQIEKWTDIQLNLRCHCRSCTADWVEHFVFPCRSYKGYTFNGKDYNEDGEEI